MAEAKAAGFNSAVETLRKMITAEEFDRLVAALPPACAGMVRKPRLATSWLPLEVTQPLFEVAFDTVFARDEERMFELGRKQFHSDLSTLYKFFIRVATPAFVAARAGRIYDTYTRNAGSMKVVDESERSYELLIDGRPRPTSGFWHYLRGSIFAVVEATHVAHPKVEIIDGGGVNAFCRYRVSWS